MNKAVDRGWRAWYVQIMNNGQKNESKEDLRSLQLLDEISRNENVTQRDLSRNLGIALGLTNSYLKNLVSKGCVTVSGIPKKRYSYYLTSKGFREKTRLTYEHLRNFTNLYRFARKDFRSLFAHLERRGIKKVAFCGVDEVAEIAYLSLKEVSLELVAVTDDSKVGKRFFDLTVSSIKDMQTKEPELVVITSFQMGDELTEALAAAGVNRDIICNISSEGWLKRIDAR